MFERFTREARGVVVRAEREARRLGAGSVEAEHLLLALTATAPMRSCGVGPDDLVAALDRAHERALAVVGVDAAAFDAPARSVASKRVTFGASARLAMERAVRFVVERGDRRIVAEHLLLGVLAAEVGTVPRALEAGDIDRGELVRATESALDAGRR